MIEQDEFDWLDDLAKLDASVRAALLRVLEELIDRKRSTLHDQHNHFRR